MKTLLLIRHAKSSWSSIGMNDHDRPLNERGKSDSKRMRSELSGSLQQCNAIYASTAKRARKTIENLHGASDVNFTDQLYTFDVNELAQFVKSIDKTYDCVAIVAHNPSLTEFINRYSDTQLINLPTCGVAKLKFMELENWCDIIMHSGKLVYFNVPKNLI